MALHYIAIEGPIGVDKTLIVDRLATRLDANKVLEDWATNPFLRHFYDGKAGAAFQTELFFLLSRYRQQQELQQRQLFAQATLCDYVFEKSRLFAYLNLDDSELLIFDKLYALLVESVPKPDLVVFLQAPTEVLVKRVRTRGRPEETALSEEYLAEVNRAYNHYFFHYSSTPLLVVNTADVDLVNEDERPRRPPEADPRDGQGHAVLRPAEPRLSGASRRPALTASKRTRRRRVPDIHEKNSRFEALKRTTGNAVPDHSRGRHESALDGSETDDRKRSRAFRTIHGEGTYGPVNGPGRLDERPGLGDAHRVFFP